MEDRLLKYIIFIWLLGMCTIDYVVLLLGLNPEQIRIVTRGFIWGTNGLLLAVWIIQNIVQKRGFIPFHEKGIFSVLYLFLFWGCASIFFSKYVGFEDVGIKRIVHFLVAFLDAYIFYDFFSRSRQNVHFFIKIVTFLVLFVSGWAALESFHKVSIGVPIFKNIFTGFSNTNFLGYFLFLFTPIFFSYYWINSPFSGDYKMARFILLVIVGYAFVLSSSRSCWNGFIFALCFLIYRKNKAWGTTIILLAIMAGLSIYIFIGGEFYQSSWQEIYSHRSSVWNWYWNTACENALWGQGLGVGVWAATDSVGMFHSHNLYLSDAAQMGMLSALLVLIFYGILLYGAVKAGMTLKDLKLKAILLGCAATYFGHLFYNLTDSPGILVPFNLSTIAIFPYILVVLPLAIKNIARRELEMEEDLTLN